MRVLGAQELEAQVPYIGMRRGRGDEERSSAMPPIGRVDEHVAEPCERGVVSHPTNEAGHLAVGAVEAEGQRLLDRAGHDFVRATLGPVALLAQPVMYPGHLDERPVIAHEVPVRTVPAHQGII